MAHRFVVLICFALVIGGCALPKDHRRVSHTAFSIDSDVPIPPFAQQILVTEIDAQSHSYRIEFSIPKNLSVAFFYDQACTAAGWHCEWMSGNLEPWAAVFYKPGRICLIEQRQSIVLIYVGSRANSDRLHHRYHR
jgi:hypothetical protein